MEGESPGEGLGWAEKGAKTKGMKLLVDAVVPGRRWFITTVLLEHMLLAFIPRIFHSGSLL